MYHEIVCKLQSDGYISVFKLMSALVELL